MSKNQNVRWVEQGRRLKELIKKLGLTQTDLAMIVGSKQSSVSHAVNGVMGVPPVWLYRLRDKYREVNIDWAQKGEGEMFLPASAELPTGAVQEPEVEYVKGNARALSSEEVAVILARLQKDVAELLEWKREAVRVIGALEVQVKRLKGE